MEFKSNGLGVKETKSGSESGHIATLNGNSFNVSITKLHNKNKGFLVESSVTGSFHSHSIPAIKSRVFHAINQ